MDKVAATNSLAATILLRALGATPIHQQSAPGASADGSAKEQGASGDQAASSASGTAAPSSESLPSVSFEFNVIPQFPTLAIKSAAGKKG
jgi:hypothetical protein